MPRSPMITPAMRFINCMWCGRKPRLNRPINRVSKNHHKDAPAKKPPIMQQLLNTDNESVAPLYSDTPNIAKKMRMYGITATKLANVKPNIEKKSFQPETVLGLSLWSFGFDFCKKIATPIIITKMPPRIEMMYEYCSICAFNNE